MRRLFGHSPAPSTRSLSALDEVQALQNALNSASLIMNDEVGRAEVELSEGTSPFHKLGLAVTFFMRATLGFEKEVIELARTKLDEAEEAAHDHQRRAVRDASSAHRSCIYPAGSEYALCHAEAQLMSAVVAVLNESLTESLKGFYKLRKAFNTLHELREAEKSFLTAQKGTTHSQPKRASETSSLASPSAGHYPTDTSVSSTSSGVLTPDSTVTDEDELEFVDAKEDTSNVTTPLAYQGNVTYPHLSTLNLDERDIRKDSSPVSFTSLTSSTITGSSSELDHGDMRLSTFTSDPIDLFIHAGTSLCFGLLQLILSLIPPAFARILNLFSFRGDRAEGLKLLWAATEFKTNINGAMAGLITLGYYNTLLHACDIIPKDAIPKQKLETLLQDMRELYPNSKLWIMEESKVLAAEHRLEGAIDLLNSNNKSSLRQVEALGKFDLALNLMYSHRYEECAETFIECIGLNSWSHALYYYIAGTCFVELYRIHKSINTDKAEACAARAEKYLHEVPAHLGKKRLMGRQLPINAFVGRKITKWEARATARGCRLVDAVGASPTVEMTYFWSGFRRMGRENIDLSLKRLAWSEDNKENPAWEKESIDEKAVLAFLKAVCQRFSGQTGAARETLRDGVLAYDLHHLKACEHPDIWTQPIAHYELAVCAWRDAVNGNMNDDLLVKCSEELTIIEKWEAFDMEARVGMKVATARQTLQKYGVSPS